jgi:CheY-like chemotaxis protein
MLTALLLNGGVRVVEAGTAEAALGLLEHTQVDLILSDIGLPGRDGYEFIRAVRAMPRLSNVPAAALTAYAGVQDRQKALDSGFQMHVPKPIEPAEFMSVIANLARLRTSMLV